MSDSDNDATVLGKRPRNGEQDGADPMEDHHEDAAGDSDDDVGPMPMPAGPEGNGAKKKRKGVYLLIVVVAYATDSSAQ